MRRKIPAFSAVVMIAASVSQAHGQAQMPNDGSLGSPAPPPFYSQQMGGMPGMPVNNAPGMQGYVAPGMQTAPLPQTPYQGAPQSQAPIIATIDQLTRKIGNMITVASMLPDGSLTIADTLAAAETVTATLGTDPCVVLRGMGFPVDRQQYELLKTVERIEKNGSRITLEKTFIETFPLGINVRGGIVDDIKVLRTVEFDMAKLENGAIMLANVRGIAIEARDSERMKKHVAKLTDITVGKDAAGQPVLNARLTNPEKWWERMVTGHHNKHVAVAIRVLPSGQIQLFQE